MKKTIWFDITNVPHVNFFLPFIERYEKDFDMIFSIRDFAETKNLFEKKINRPYLMVGSHKGGNKLKKAIGSLERVSVLQRTIPYFDIKISVGGDAAGMVTQLRRKLSITFDDNEKSPNWTYSPFSDFAFWPKAISVDDLHKQFFKDRKLYQYDGYKEDIYLADYVPNPSFKAALPFEHYVVVRPENVKASYVGGGVSIVPELLKRLTEMNLNIIFLPRYESDREYAKDCSNIYVPPEAINGLDACYYADAVLTGAGTMAREAACLGVPAISFYAGKELLTVDQSLIAKGKMAFSRDVDEISGFLKTASRKEEDMNRCKSVQMEVFTKLDEVINNYLSKK